MRVRLTAFQTSAFFLNFQNGGLKAQGLETILLREIVLA